MAFFRPRTQHEMRTTVRAGVAALAGWALTCVSLLGLTGCTPEPASHPIVKLAFIDPLSGPLGEVGRNQLLSWQWVAQRHNASAAPGQVRFEVVGFDNKGSPQESVNTVKVVIDQGFRYIVQGNSSAVAHLIVETLNKHNNRAPGREVLYLNYAAMDPELTNEQCNPWHFRVDADTSMKVKALVHVLRAQSGVRKVFLINQNYAHGQQVSAHFKSTVASDWPQARIVGDELHPLISVNNFEAHVGRIRNSGADAVVTGNWGPDLSRLLEAMRQAKLHLPVYSYYAAVTGTPQVLVDWPEAEVFLVAANHSEHDGELGELMRGFRQAHGQDFYSLATHTGLNLLASAMKEANSTEPVRVRTALSGLRVSGLQGQVSLRARDHQLQTGLWLSKWQLAASPDKALVGTDHTFAPVAFVPAERLSTPTVCAMTPP